MNIIGVSFQKLHERYADTALDIILSLRGLFVKIGQLASMRDDAMPRRVFEAISPPSI